MNTLEVALYRCIVMLHPAEFRQRFGSEMLLDFEDALPKEGFLSLCRDGLVSLFRQWIRCVAPQPKPTSATRPSLLSGHYVTASPGNPGLVDLFRASILYAAFLCLVLSISGAIHSIQSDDSKMAPAGKSSSTYVSGGQQAWGSPATTFAPGRIPVRTTVIPSIFGRSIKRTRKITAAPPSVEFDLSSYIALAILFVLLGWFLTNRLIIKLSTVKRES